jgi:hypothetical protein
MSVGTTAAAGKPRRAAVAGAAEAGAAPVVVVVTDGVGVSSAEELSSVFSLASARGFLVFYS